MRSIKLTSFCFFIPFVFVLIVQRFSLCLCQHGGLRNVGLLMLIFIFTNMSIFGSLRVKILRHRIRKLKHHE